MRQFLWEFLLWLLWKLPRQLWGLFFYGNYFSNYFESFSENSLGTSLSSSSVYFFGGSLRNPFWGNPSCGNFFRSSSGDFHRSSSRDSFRNSLRRSVGNFENMIFPQQIFRRFPKNSSDHPLRYSSGSFLRNFSRNLWIITFKNSFMNSTGDSHKN